MADTISSKIASSFLDTSSKAESVVADVYKEKGDSVLNNALNKFGSKTDGMSTAILNSKLDIKGISKKLGLSKLIPADVNNIGDRVTNAVGGKLAAIGNYAKGLGNTAAQNILGLDAAETSEITKLAFESGKVLYALKDTQVSNVTELFGVLDQVVGETGLGKFIDGNATVGLLQSCIGAAVDLGITDVIDAVMANIKDKETARKILIASLETVALQGDFRAVNKIIGYIGVDSALQRVPDLIQELLGAYMFPYDDETLNWNKEFGDFNSLLNKIDPNWLSTKRNGKSVNKLWPFTYATTDSKQLFEFGYKNDKVVLAGIMIANTYPTNDLIKIIEDHWPLAVIADSAFKV